MLLNIIINMYLVCLAAFLITPFWPSVSIKLNTMFLSSDMRIDSISASQIRAFFLVFFLFWLKKTLETFQA